MRSPQKCISRAGGNLFQDLRFRRASVLAILCLFLAGCSGYKMPALDSAPHEMSADTLCYRYAHARDDPAVKREVHSRGLDCGQVLRSQEDSGLF